MNRLITITASVTRVVIGTLFVLSVLMLLLSSIVTKRASAESTNQSDSGVLLTVHDRGATQVLVTRAMTVGEALDGADIELDSRDVVEPALDQELVGDEYQVNIYRARPVTVVDGGLRQKVMTAYQTPKKITEQVGIKLHPEDEAEIRRSDDLLNGGAGLELHITRAKEFNFVFYGSAPREARTQASTVGQMLASKGISLDVNDRVLPGLSEPIKSGMTVKIWREGKQTITVNESLDFPIEKIKDADQYYGYKSVQTEGKPGMQSVTYEIEIKDGVEVSRTKIASIVVAKPVTQVEIVGAKSKGVYTTPSENENITWDYLRAQGFSREQTAGIMGNLMQEHRFNTSHVGGGLGIAQWIGGRADNLYRMAESQNRDPFDIRLQLDYLMHELNGGYVRVKNQILSATTVEDSVRYFQNGYERCGICNEGQRIIYAYNILASH